jgi:NIMA (never in mitosis gene a)-related kinase
MPYEDYDVVRACGAGSFASVFKVKRRSDSKNYAMKKVQMAKMDKKAVQDTLNEVRFLASFEHPNVVLFLEAFVVKRDMCIVMEYCGSGDLSSKVQRYKVRGE